MTTREEIARVLCERRSVPVGSASWDAYLADADAILALSPPESTEGGLVEASRINLDALYKVQARGQFGDAAWLVWPSISATLRPVPLQDRASAPDVVRDAARYRRLQILGCAPCGSSALRTATVLRFTNLDAFVDDDMKWNPSRGEAHPLPTPPMLAEQKEGKS